jgi:hypothetical protein
MKATRTMDLAQELEHLRRQVEEHDQMIHALDDVLRGRGDDLGLIGWMVVIRRTWIALVGLLGAAIGYALNDLVDALKNL